MIRLFWYSSEVTFNLSPNKSGDALPFLPFVTPSTTAADFFAQHTSFSAGSRYVSPTNKSQKIIEFVVTIRPQLNDEVGSIFSSYVPHAHGLLAGTPVNGCASIPEEEDIAGQRCE